MKRLTYIALLIIASMALTACHWHSDHHHGSSGSAAVDTDFTQFAKQLVKQAPDGAPVSTNNRKFNNLGTANSGSFASVDFGDKGATTLATKACDTDSGCQPGIHGPQSK